MRVAPAGTQAPSFGALLRDLRLASGLSQEALAERAGMISGGISVLERGARRAPQRETMRLLADALQLSSHDRLRLEQAAQRSGTARHRTPRKTTATLPEVGNLPFALTSFVGRERSSASLRQNLLGHRLVTVTGPGGVGKTRLAIEVAHAVRAEFPDGVWLVELAPLTDGESVGPRVAATLGLPFEGGSSLDRLIAELSDRRCAIVLDNCEHVLGACAAFAVQLLQRCEGVHVLATSREPLHVLGERICRLDPLTELQATQLFVERASSLEPNFTLEDDETAGGYVRSICRSLDGIPLALELAAARVPSLSLKVIAENLNERLSILRSADRSVSPRQQTMRTMIDWSYDLLSPDEQRTFARLSIFAGGCGLEAATMVCSGDGIDGRRVLDVLTSLVDKSMIVVDVAGRDLRYSMLEITREYARERLLDSREFDLVAARHAQAYQELAQRVEPRGSIPDALWQSVVEAELENWRAALEWALVDRHDVPVGLNIAAALPPVWMLFSPFQGREWLRTAIALTDEETAPVIRAKLHYGEALFALRAGEDAIALTEAEKALPDYRRLGDVPGVARAQKVAGMSLIYTGRLDEGESLLQEALQASRTAGDSILAASIVDCLGTARSLAGDFDGAKAHFTQAYALYEAAGSERDALYASVGLGEAYFRAGDAESALRLASEALGKAGSLPDAYLVMATTTNIAGYLIALRRFDEAYAHAREAVHLASRAHYEVALTWALAHLSAAAAFRLEAIHAPQNDFLRWAYVLGFVRAQVARSNAQRDFAIELAMDGALQILSKHVQPTQLSATLAAGSSMTSRRVVEEALASP